jgi:2-polyprenyl-3-methyl-5-hydroxy-6-metoxy-1,4-benzoquinol methylase
VLHRRDRSDHLARAYAPHVTSEASGGRSATGYPDWAFDGAAPNHHYLVPGIMAALAPLPPGHLLDLGCGNGALTGRLREAGWDVTGVEGTASGLERARRCFPDITFVAHDLTEPLPDALRHRFDVVVSAEVIEHLFLPRELFARAREALGPAGHLVVTTPYHGYWKNLALAVTGRLDHHHQPQADYGHIKFFSGPALQAMAAECGFRPVSLIRAGRVRPLAATMIMLAERD